MADYGYLNHTFIDERDDQAINAMFAYVPGEHVIIEQEFARGEGERPAFEKLLSALAAGDTLYISSIDALGLNYGDAVRLWKHITKEIGAYIVVLNDPALNSRFNSRLSVRELKASARAAYKALSPGV